jgi:glycosyltransferase involved in cell wall biosynthesis
MIPAEPKKTSSSEPEFSGVTFVVPAHNEQNYLGPTLEQLNKIASKLLREFEIIVVNDASTDSTPQIALDSGARVINVDLRNIGAVRNAGAKEAGFEWIVFVDADTIVPEETLVGSLKALSKGAVGGGAYVSLDQIQPVGWFKMGLYYAVSLIWQTLGRWAAGCYMFCRKDAFEFFGGFDEQYFAAEELFFSVELKRLGKFQLVRFPVITSSRKFYNYTPGQLIRFIVLPLSVLLKRAPLRSRFGLELLYEDDR